MSAAIINCWVSGDVSGDVDATMTEATTAEQLQARMLEEKLEVIHSSVRKPLISKLQEFGVLGFSDLTILSATDVIDIGRAASLRTFQQR